MSHGWGTPSLEESQMLRVIMELRMDNWSIPKVSKSFSFWATSGLKPGRSELSATDPVEVKEKCEGLKFDPSEEFVVCCRNCLMHFRSLYAWNRRVHNCFVCACENTIQKGYPILLQQSALYKQSNAQVQMEWYLASTKQLIHSQMRSLKLLLSVSEEILCWLSWFDNRVLDQSLSSVLWRGENQLNWSFFGCLLWNSLLVWCDGTECVVSIWRGCYRMNQLFCKRTHTSQMTTKELVELLSYSASDPVSENKVLVAKLFSFMLNIFPILNGSTHPVAFRIMQCIHNHMLIKSHSESISEDKLLCGKDVWFTLP